MKYNFNETQDWVKYYSKLSNYLKDKNFLEFGLGVGTEFFLDHCKEVTSVEFSLGDYNKQWFDKSMKDYENYKKWFPNYVLMPEEIIIANDLAQSQRFPLKDSSYLKSLHELMNPFLNNRDVIFVDAGIHLRGDMVNYCFNKAEVISAHDTSRDENRILKNIYGYNIVKVPENYLEIHFEDTYMGTTFWINKNLVDVISLLKA
jgi:hypothetical protein